MFGLGIIVRHMALTGYAAAEAVITTTCCRNDD